MKNDFLEALRVLGLDQQATREEIEEAYLGQVKRWHPDRFMNDECRRREAEQRLKALNSAYVCLKSFQPSPTATASPQPKPEQGEARPSQDCLRQRARATGRSAFHVNLQEKESRKRLKVKRKTPPEKTHWTAKWLWWRIMGEGSALLLLVATGFATWKWIVPRFSTLWHVRVDEWIAFLKAGGGFLGGASALVLVFWVLFSSEPAIREGKPRQKKSKPPLRAATPPSPPINRTALPEQPRTALPETRAAHSLTSNQGAKSERRIRRVS